MTQIDMLKFCGVDDFRLYLNAPWRDRGRLYASNGHYAIELDDDGREAVARDKHPDVPAILEKYRATAEWAPIPPLPPPHFCAVCKGKGVYRLIDCDDCEGHGSFEHGRHEYDCMGCGGNGLIGDPDKDTRCDCCGGLGEAIKPWVPVGFALNNYAAHYLRVVAGLPDVLVVETGKGQPLAFKFTGGRGLVMPMRRD